jgi:hypothetical protein
LEAEPFADDPFIDAEQVDAAVAGDGPGQHLVVGGLPLPWPDYPAVS